MWEHLYKAQKQAKLKHNVRQMTGSLYIQKEGRGLTTRTHKRASITVATFCFWIWEVIRRWVFSSNFLGSMLREVSQTEKDRYCMTSLIGETQKHNKLVNVTSKKQTPRYRGKTVGRGARYRGGAWEVQIWVWPGSRVLQDTENTAKIL